MFRLFAKWRMRRLEKKFEEVVKNHPCMFPGPFHSRFNDGDKEVEIGPKTAAISNLAFLSVAEQMEKCDEGKLIPLVTNFPLRTPTSEIEIS